MLAVLPHFLSRLVALRSVAVPLLHSALCAGINTYLHNGGAVLVGFAWVYHPPSKACGWLYSRA